MKKITSIILTAMLVSATCVCTMGVSADEEVNCPSDIPIRVVDACDGSSKTYIAGIGDKVEFTVTGTSEKEINAFLAATYINQSSAENLVEDSIDDTLKYDFTAYTNEDGETTFYDASSMPGMSVRPEDESEANRDKFGYCYTAPSGTSYADGKVMVKFAVEVNAFVGCDVVTVVEDASYDENGDIISDPSVLSTKTTVTINGETPEEPTEEPTEVPTEEPTVEPTEAPTTEPTEAPTSATNATVAPTVVPTTATNATVAPTKAATSAAGTTTGNTTTNSGKVTTGDTTAVIALFSVLMAAAGVVVVAKKKARG